MSELHGLQLLPTGLFRQGLSNLAGLLVVRDQENMIRIPDSDLFQIHRDPSPESRCFGPDWNSTSQFHDLGLHPGHRRHLKRCGATLLGVGQDQDPWFVCFRQAI
ncbi:MAG: hypothetical protein NTU59_02605, partial [Coprothermobacterota bacterium]|nr:hypothetical protein [Coprothermobacterota bacterium]